MGDIKVKTDTGFEKATDIHLTQPYKIYEIELENGYKLECADNHILFDENFNQIFCKNLTTNSYIQTDLGLSKVVKISKSKYKLSMFDLTIDHSNHRFYSNGILSHNTINAAISILHFITFNNDKNVMIVANLRDTTIEIIDKIKSIYVNLPFFLKVGIKNWNQKSMVCENGCKIRTAARSKTPAIGFTIDFLYLDEFAHIPSNIIEPYYTAVYPIVSAVNNSKIIITSTPKGMNLFYKLLTDSERPENDPLSTNFKSKRIYWYEIEGRFVTYFRLYPNKLLEYDITREEIFEQVQAAFPQTKVEMKYIADLEKDVIYIYNKHNNIILPSDEVKKFLFVKNEKEYFIQNLAYVTTWQEETIKEIGGEDAFNQEYGLRFVDGSRSLLNEALIDELMKNKKDYIYYPSYEFDRRLKFNYEDLKFLSDTSIYSPLDRNKVHGIFSIDISEGLGQDYSIINMFKITPKPIEIVDLYKKEYTCLSDFFCLEQFGLYRSNYVSVKQLAELFYTLAFEYFNPENFKAVLEYNTYGGEFLAHLPNLFEGNNQYGSGIFFRYKHRVDSDEERIGIRVNSNKELLVKDYQDAMNKRNFIINNPTNITEITTFIKHITPSGNIRYAADTGNDDCLLPDTLIKTINGYKPIKDIKLGELVLTHLGNYKKVINICERNFKGNMYKLKFRGKLELNLTYNHPIYIYPNKYRQNSRFNKNNTNSQWLLPNEINNNNICVSIRENLLENQNLTIKYTDLYEINKFSYENNVKLKEICLDKNFAKFLGLFLADGNCYQPKNDVYRMSIAFNKNHIELISWVKNYLNSIGLKYYERLYKKVTNSYTLIFNDKTLFTLLNKCYNENREKILPEYAYKLGKDLEFLLEYWLIGDGWLKLSKNNRKKCRIGCSISRQLALSMMDIANSIGKYAIISKNIRKRYEKRTKDQYWVTIYDEKIIGAVDIDISNFEYGSRIDKVDIYNYEGLVYNLEVEDDNSYIAEGLVLHNCVMSIVNSSSVFPKYAFKEMVESIAHTLVDSNTLSYYKDILKNQEMEDYNTADYSALINVNRQRKFINSYNNTNNGNWFK